MRGESVFLVVRAYESNRARDLMRRNHSVTEALQELVVGCFRVFGAVKDFGSRYWLD